MKKLRTNKITIYITTFLFIILATSSIYVIRPHDKQTYNTSSNPPIITTNLNSKPQTINDDTGTSKKNDSTDSDLALKNLTQLDINNIEQQQNQLIFKDNEVWYESSEQKKRLSQSLPADLKDEKHIALNRNLISQLTTKQTFSMTIPQTGKAFEFTVEDIHTHKNGDRTWRGVYRSGRNTFYVVLTQGKNSTYGSIDTPDGNFVLQAIGNAGWIASKSTLKQQHDHSDSDAVVLTLPESIPPLHTTQF